jgi:hydrogenase maturation protease
MRTLIGAVGYRFLRDHSAAFAVLDRLEQSDLGPDVTVEDVSYNPIALVQWLQGEAKDAFDQVVFVAAAGREGRAAGEVDVYRWDRALPSDELIQQAVTDAVTGIISLDNTIVVAGHFNALPARVAIVDIEPREHEFGTALSPEVAVAVETAIAVVRALASDASAFDALPLAGLPDARHGVRPQFGIQIRKWGLTPGTR